MSFILDSLRKLEEKQARDTTRELLGSGGGVPQPAGRSRGRLLAGAGIVLAGTALVSAWFLLRADHPPGEAGPSAERVIETTPPVLPVPGGARQAGDPPQASVPTPATAETEVPAGDTGVESGSGAVGEPAAEGVAEPVVSIVAEAAPVETTVPPAAEGESVAEEVAEPDPEPAGVGSEVEAAVPPDRLLSFEELPDEIRAALKELTITGHIYSSDPLLRRLNVNDGMWREGDSLPVGATIEEINERGAVFRYVGYRFSMGVHP